MAYDFFPKSQTEIVNTLNKAKFSGDAILEITNLYNTLKSYKLDTPINLDLKEKKKCNVSRQLSSKTTIASLKQKVGLKTVAIKFGNGSSGNRGSNNKGNAFEEDYMQALFKWWAGDTDIDAKVLTSIEDLDKTYNLRSLPTFTVTAEGAANTRRPLDFSGGNITITNPGSGKNVGSAVTDLTINKDKNPIYLSLKSGGTTTFFNVGVRTILTPEEIKSQVIKNKDGLKLLKLFGIDTKLFCKVFNGQMTIGKVDRSPSINRGGIKELLETGIGYGYHVIHEFPGKVISKRMNEAAMRRAANVTGTTIYYGGKTGTGKRIDMEMTSDTYIFKLNIRDTQGYDGYPTRMMCDFTYK